MKRLRGKKGKGKSIESKRKGDVVSDESKESVSELLDILDECEWLSFSMIMEVMSELSEKEYSVEDLFDSDKDISMEDLDLSDDWYVKYKGGDE